MRRNVALSVALVACGSSSASVKPAAPAEEPSIEALRARGPAALDALFAVYDRLPDGRERRALAERIDAVAAQRYAHVSRLYWYTDLDEARRAAVASGKPILSLRLLGDLRQELTCVNSRFFRVALYANRDLSRFLREDFILHWSSERPAARVTVDFGDGRKLERTVAGNSIHYVLDAKGRVIEALPGLWSPAAFRQELEAALPLARRTAAMGDGEAQLAVRTFHEGKLEALAASWGRGGRPPAANVAGGTVLEAERLTVSKAFVETPLIRALKLGPQISRVPDDAVVWTELGARSGGARLDDQSIALIRAIGPTDWGLAPRPLGPKQLAALILGFEQRIAADTALNRWKVGWALHEWMAREPARDLASLNRRVYSELFLTPDHDPWLGMAARNAFLALPGDGLVVAAAAAPPVAQR